jgi:hypothetical protein
MHCTEAVVVAVNQRIGHGLAKGAHVHQGNRYAKQSYLQLSRFRAWVQ